ncbi:MAG: hypothetical protein EBR10_10755 [Planctomycetes bacterium]|nr:hypothetical protein [Planctomycetota bacterium]
MALALAVAHGVALLAALAVSFGASSQTPAPAFTGFSVQRDMTVQGDTRYRIYANFSSAEAVMLNMFDHGVPQTGQPPQVGAMSAAHQQPGHESWLPVGEAGAAHQTRDSWVTTTGLPQSSQVRLDPSFIEADQDGNPIPAALAQIPVSAGWFDATPGTANLVLAGSEGGWLGQNASGGFQMLVLQVVRPGDDLIQQLPLYRAHLRVGFKRQGTTTPLFGVGSYVIGNSLAQRNWTGGGGSNQWNDAANWQPNGVPQFGEIAVIPAGQDAVVYPGGEVTLAGLQCERPLLISGGVLGVAQGGEAAVAALQLDGGEARGGTWSVEETSVSASSANRISSAIWNGDWALSENSAQLRIKDVELNGRATLSGSCSGLWFEGTQEFPSGEIVFDYEPEYWDPEASYRPWLAMWGYGQEGSGTLTLGSEVVVRGGFGVIGRNPCATTTTPR